MKVLIAEDSELSRSVLSSILSKENYHVIEAEHGQQAVDKYLEYDPDVILMDLMMPVMDGYAATKKIKELAGNKFIPIIAITSSEKPKSLINSVENGADDFLNKPYDSQAINAKIIALTRIKKLHDSLREQEKKLDELNKQAESELLVAKHIYDCVLDKGFEQVTNVQKFMKPVTQFNGDILLSAYTPSGGFNVMLGDFTGHGLTAAIGAIPTSDIFYQMTAKGFSIGDIVVELNERLEKVLPPNMFCAASFIEIDKERTTMSVWNGSMPDIIVTNDNGVIISRIASSHTALGILPPEKFDRDIDIISLHGNERVYIASDGVLDVRDKDSIKFGMNNYVNLFQKSQDTSTRLEEIVNVLFDFVHEGEVNDDISIIEVSVDSAIDSWQVDTKGEAGIKRIATEWSASITFEADALKKKNPVPLLLNMVNGINVIQGHKERLYTVLSELFSNSLEHGFLRLDSSLKASPNGFQEYFSQRELRLKELSNAKISINMEQKQIEGKWVIVIDVKDNGSGFDTNASRKSLKNNADFSGRGIELVIQLCDSVEYNEKGNEVRAIYSFNKENK